MDWLSLNSIGLVHLRATFVGGWGMGNGGGGMDNEYRITNDNGSRVMSKI